VALAALVYCLSIEGGVVGIMALLGVFLAFWLTLGYERFKSQKRTSRILFMIGEEMKAIGGQIQKIARDRAPTMCIDEFQPAHTFTVASHIVQNLFSVDIYRAHLSEMTNADYEQAKRIYRVYQAVDVILRKGSIAVGKGEESVDIPADTLQNLIQKVRDALNLPAKDGGKEVAPVKHES